MQADGVAFVASADLRLAVIDRHLPTLGRLPAVPVRQIDHDGSKLLGPQRDGTHQDSKYDSRFFQNISRAAQVILIVTDGLAGQLETMAGSERRRPRKR